jgi:hypothetical protein
VDGVGRVLGGELEGGDGDYTHSVLFCRWISGFVWDRSTLYLGSSLQKILSLWMECVPAEN